MSLLNNDELAAAQAELTQWQFGEKSLNRELAFPDFVRAFGFMGQVALVAERIDPDPRAESRC